MVITEPTVPRRRLSSGFETAFCNLVPRALFRGQGKAPWGRGCALWQNGAHAQQGSYLIHESFPSAPQ